MSHSIFASPYQPAATIRVDGIPMPKGSGSRKLIPAQCPSCYRRLSLRSGIGRLGPYIESADCATKTQPANRLKRWSEAIAASASIELSQPLPSPIALALTFTLPRPASVKRDRPTVKPDCDKLARSIQDALEGIAYAQDSEIVDLSVCKIYGDAPGVLIEIHSLSRQENLL